MLIAKSPATRQKPYGMESALCDLLRRHRSICRPPKFNGDFDHRTLQDDVAVEVKHAGPPIAVTKVSPLIGDAILIKTRYVLSASSDGELWLDNLRAQSSKCASLVP